MTIRIPWPALLAGASALLVLAGAPLARAQAGGAAPSEFDAVDTSDPDSADWASWIQTLEQHADKLRELRKTSTQLQDEVDAAISRRYPRGEEKERLLAANERAHKDLAEAEQQLPELIEQARRAGVPQGLLQDYEDLETPPAADDDEGDW